MSLPKARSTMWMGRLSWPWCAGGGAVVGDSVHATRGRDRGTGQRTSFQVDSFAGAPVVVALDSDRYVQRPWPRQKPICSSYHGAPRAASRPILKPLAKCLDISNHIHQQQEPYRQQITTATRPV